VLALLAEKADFQLATSGDLGQVTAVFTVGSVEEAPGGPDAGKRITVAVVTRGGVFLRSACFKRSQAILMRYGGPEGEARCLESLHEGPCAALATKAERGRAGVTRSRRCAP